jgi:hypothetical protein
MEPKPKKKYKKDETPSVLRKQNKKLAQSKEDWKDKNRERQASLKQLKKQFEDIKKAKACIKLECMKNANDLHDSNLKIQELERELLVEKLAKLHLYETIEQLKKKARQ